MGTEYTGAEANHRRGTNAEDHGRKAARLPNTAAPRSKLHAGELRHNLVQARALPAGRGTAFPQMKKTRLSYSQKQLQQVLTKLSQQNVGSTALDDLTYDANSDSTPRNSQPE